MQSLVSILSSLFGQAFAALDLDSTLGEVTASNRPDLGDFQCNGALRGAKQKKTNPRALAQSVIDTLPRRDLFAQLSVAGPGFINIRLSDEFLSDHVQQMADDTAHGAGAVAQPRTVIIDYGGPNVAKPLHVGHLRAGIIGQVLVNLYRFRGDQVIGDAHLGDWGTQMGMLITEMQRRQPDLIYFDPDYTGPYPEVSPVSIDDLAEMYPVASARAKSDPAAMEAARRATFEQQQGRPGYRALWQHFWNVSVADLREDYARLNINFDLWLGESDTRTVVPALIERLQRDGSAVESDGALIVDVSRVDDTKEIPPLMLLKSDGAVLYGTTDLATLLQRMRDYKPDAVLYVVDNRQSLHFRQVFRAAYQTGIVPESTELAHIAFGTMNGPDGKPFKTRAGGVMQLKDLLAMVRDAALERMEQSDVGREYSAEERQDIARMVGLAALKFGDLINHRLTDYVFDLERFVAFEGRTGPYLLYSTVRTKSILRKAAAQRLVGGRVLPPAYDVERSLMLKLAELPVVVLHAYETRAPNHLCEYGYQLASEFNSFYRQCHILSEEDAAVQASWLSLSALFVDVMTSVLTILGIEVPDRM